MPTATMQINPNRNGSALRMPLEVMARVFKFYVPDDIINISLLSKPSTRLTLSAPLVLSAVCRKWRTVAHRTPQLWTNVPLLVGPSNVQSLPALTKQWVQRSGKDPLSINIYAAIDEPQKLIKLIEVLNQCSIRWMNLKYEGPSEALSYFSSAARGISHLQTLSLRTFSGAPSVFDLRDFVLRPKRLEMVGISWLEPVNFDWSCLTEVLIEDGLCVAECLEVLRRAQRLKRCTLRPDYPQFPNTDADFLPQINNNSIMDLTIIGPCYPAIFTHLRCPSLTTLTISMFGGWAPMYPMVAFIHDSSCSITNLFLDDVQLMDEDIDWLCEYAPTLRHLYIKAESLPQYRLFQYLAKSWAFGMFEFPYYLPELRSLTLWQFRSMELSSLPSIFGVPSLNGAFRHNLRNVEISFGQFQIESPVQKPMWLERERRYLLSLKENGVQLKVEARTPYGRNDLI